MTYQVLARKWRPQNFTELVGQTEVLAALIHGLNEQRLHHAYLFTGTRGVGKTTVARIVAKALNCEHGISSNPCGTCQSCIEIKEGRYPDLIEIDAASRTKVEDTREILDNIQYAPSKGQFKVYLIDEVHMLSTHSFNALLKTLEEPPEHVKFLLATTDPQKLPITVLSRCLQFHLKNIPQEVITERLDYILNQEKIKFEPEALKLISKSAQGSLRDALSLTDQAINQGEGQVNLKTTQQMLGATSTESLYQLVNHLVNKDSIALFELLENLSQELIDYQDLLDNLLEIWYEISLKQQAPNVKHFEHPESLIEELAKKLNANEVQLFYQICLLNKRDLTLAPTPLLGFKMLMLRLLSFYPLSTEVNTSKPQATNTTEAKRPNPTTEIPKKETARPIAEKTTSTESTAPTEPKKLEITNWPELVELLPLNGIGKQLARHMSFAEQQGNTLKFILAENHRAILNNRLHNDLSKTLSHYFGQEVLLQIDINSNNENSPAALKMKEEAEKQTSLQEKLNLDANLDFIKNNFNATIANIKTLK